MESNFNGNVVLPQTVEGLISRICHEQNQPPLPNATRQELANFGEERSLRILEKIRRAPIRSFDGFVRYMIRNESNDNGSPHKRSSPSQPNRSLFPSPAKTSGLMMSSQRGDNVNVISTPVTPLLSSTLNVPTEETFSPQLVALGELEFRKAFLILNYIGLNRLEEVITADEIREFKNMAMDEFESKVWDSLGQHYAPTDRIKSLEWESGKTYEYHCHVNEDGSYSFKGPYLEKSRSHLQRVLGEDNVLLVKFAKVTDGKSSAGGGYAEYKKIAKEGLLVGLRRYRFFVFKVGGKKAKKKDPTTTSVKCFFVRFESNASIDDGKEYVLSGKTIREARSVFMHVHTISNMSKYMARFSLILSKTMKLDVDLADVNFEVIEDIPCQDKDGNPVFKDGEHCIHTDGTGYISEDLALKCPKNVFKGSVVDGANVEIGALVGESSSMKSTESHRRVPPLLIQLRLFYNGFAVKGTVLVNKKLPPRTIQVRRSMVKVYPDKNISKICTRNSLEVVKTSNQPKRTTLSKNLILLLSYGGVPDDFFMDILKNALEESHAVFSNKRTALKVALNCGGMDDLSAAKMILSGIPLDESYLQYRMSIMLNQERKGLLGGRLPITESYYLMGTVFPSEDLESDEVCIILDHGQISGKVLVYRQPGLHFGDIHLLNARYVKELEEYVGHAKYAIFFPCKGPRSLADEMAGGDFDGDLFFISQNPRLLEYFKVSEPWKENCSTPAVPGKGPGEFSDEELESELFDSFLRSRFQPSYAVGIAADNWYAIMDRFLTIEDSNSFEKGVMKKDLLRLIDLYYEALDAPKSGNKVEVPEDLRVSVFPHYLERENSFKSTSILGKIYDSVKSYEEESRKGKEIRKLPCFNVGFPEDWRAKWTALYEQYRNDMTRALNASSKELKDSAANAVFDKYKPELYGGAELEDRQKPLDQIHKEALAIYNICYDYAIRKDDVNKCGFAWKVAGSALLRLYALEQGEKMLPCAPSVLKELFSYDRGGELVLDLSPKDTVGGGVEDIYDEDCTTEDQLVTPWTYSVASGYSLLRDPHHNKGLAFTETERDSHYLRGLLPPAVVTQQLQEKKLMNTIRSYQVPLQKYMAMMELQERNERLFYKLLIDNVEELLPVVYTPTVGEACLKYGSIFRRPQGLYISLKEKGKVLDVLKNWPERSIQVIVVTDGERILGLGDLGCQGMGIPVGKLSLYTALGGVRPSVCLPVTIDVGTNNEAFLKDEFYIGLRQKRATGQEYADLLHEFMTAVKQNYGEKVLIQFEDFANHNAFTLLAKYGTSHLVFNDDIQGTASVVLAGVVAALKLIGGSLADHRFLFLGAGEAGTGIGIAELIALEMSKQTKAPLEETRKKIWLMDSKGLIVSSRKDSLQHFKKPWAHDHEPVKDLLGAVKAIKPTVLIGSSGVGRTFTKEIIETVASLNEKPLILALSNPTSQSECTAEEAYTWSQGRAIFASGSPFDPFEYNGKVFVPGQANNAYIFPGFGLGLVISGAIRVHDDMLLAASEALAKQVSKENYDKGLIYPPFSNIRKISAEIAANVAAKAYELVVATRLPRPANLMKYAESCMYSPVYRCYR